MFNFFSCFQVLLFLQAEKESDSAKEMKNVYTNNQNNNEIKRQKKMVSTPLYYWYLSFWDDKITLWLLTNDSFVFSKCYYCFNLGTGYMLEKDCYWGVKYWKMCRKCYVMDIHWICLEGISHILLTECYHTVAAFPVFSITRLFSTYIMLYWHWTMFYVNLVVLIGKEKYWFNVWTKIVMLWIDSSALMSN